MLRLLNLQAAKLSPISGLAMFTGGDLKSIRRDCDASFIQVLECCDATNPSTTIVFNKMIQSPLSSGIFPQKECTILVQVDA